MFPCSLIVIYCLSKSIYFTDFIRSQNNRDLRPIYISLTQNRQSLDIR
jgi:hypothetical protein